MSIGIEEKIDFRQERSFNELISASVNFAKQENKKLYKWIVFYCLPIALFVYLGLNFVTFFHQTSEFIISGHESAWSNFIRSAFYFIGFFLFQLIIFSYVREYNDSNGAIDSIKVRKLILNKLGTAFGWTIALIILITGIGFLINIVPGLPQFLKMLLTFFSIIYFLVSTVFTVPVIFFETERNEWPFIRSFKLIKKNWWITFGLGIFLAVTTYGTKMIVTLLMNTGIQTGILQWPIPPLINNLSYVIFLLLQSFSAILLSFHYFNLVERKEMQSLLNRIENVGIEQ